MAPRMDGDLVPALPVLGWLQSGRTTPLRFGMAVFAAMLLLRIAVIALSVPVQRLFSEEAQPFELRDLRIGIVMALLFGYAMACYGWAVGGLGTQLDALRPLFGRSGGTLEGTRSLAGRLPRRMRRRTIVGGVAAALLVPVIVDRDPLLFLDRDYWHPQNLLNWILLPFLGALMACVGRSLWEDARRFTRVADRIEPLDLLDTRSLAPFGRHALRIALLTIGFPSFGALLISDHGFAELILGLAIGGAIMATTAFLLPVQGIHRRLVAEKDAELSRIRAALRGDTAALEKSGLGAWRSRATPADLLAYEARIHAVREWPFDVPTLTRFAALFLLPLGSWLGGALVERIVTQLFG